MENQCRVGLVRMERAIKEKMSIAQDIETSMPHELINAKPMSAVVPAPLRVTPPITFQNAA